MNDEQIEHELNNNRGNCVTVVRPGYGHQSDSWAGTLSVTHAECPMIFQVSSDVMATIFCADDVINAKYERIGIEGAFVIRLKGPNDYLHQAVNV